MIVLNVFTSSQKLAYFETYSVIYKDIYKFIMSQYRGHPHYSAKLCGDRQNIFKEANTILVNTNEKAWKKSDVDLKIDEANKSNGQPVSSSKDIIDKIR